MQPILETKAGNYRWQEPWVEIPSPKDSPQEPNGRTHGVVVAKNGLVYIFHQAVPSILVYTPEGEFVKSWGEYPGAHGLTLVEEDGQEFLWLADQTTAKVEKTTLDGAVVQSIPKPAHPAYEEGKYVPTWVAVNEVRHGGNGDIWVADGYGQSLIHRYNAEGCYLATLDGTEGAGRFKCPHGIAFDPRKPSPELYVADRGHKRVQVYDGEGNFKRVFGADFLTSPDGFVYFEDRLIIPELLGRLTLLDAQDRLIDHLGSNEPITAAPGWPNTSPIEPGKFSSPHGAGVDAAGNLFVVEWRIGGRVIKLERLPS